MFVGFVLFIYILIFLLGGRDDFVVICHLAKRTELVYVISLRFKSIFLLKFS